FGPVFTTLQRRGREVGLCFASALIVHLGLAVWLFRVSVNQPIPDSSVFFFSLGIVATLILTIYSVKRLPEMLKPTYWRIVPIIATEYIAFLFLSDFAMRPLESSLKHLVGYLPFSIMSVVGPLLRVAALTLSFKRGRDAQRRPSSTMA